jgi:hypothetical protein
MAMFLRQKDIETTVRIWIKDACLLMVDDVTLNAADSSLEFNSERALLKAQRAEWETVRSLSIQLSL